MILIGVSYSQKGRGNSRIALEEELFSLNEWFWHYLLLAKGNFTDIKTAMNRAIYGLPLPIKKRILKIPTLTAALNTKEGLIVGPI